MYSHARDGMAASNGPAEFFVNVELHVPGKQASQLRKPLASKKKSDSKLDFLRPLAEESQRKLREKSSWLNIKSSNNADQWRPATCKLSEEGDACVLRIYLDEISLCQSIHINLLNHCDIRLADPSLFLRKDCIGIHCVSGQRWPAPASNDPVYLHFPNPDNLSPWVALLRSYATPEIYGRAYSADGGLYRMWREVSLTVSQGRNLSMSVASPPSATATATAASQTAGTRAAGVPEPVPDSPAFEGNDVDLYCEILVNDTVSGRTSTKRSSGSPDWLEDFTFSDLPPFDHLVIVVYRDKRQGRPVVVGNVTIALNNFKRGESVFGWWPVIAAETSGSSLHIGDLRLKMRVDEEIILPHEAYSDFLETLNSRNSLDWIQDLETRLHMDSAQLRAVSTQFISLAAARDVIVEHINEVTQRDVDGSPSSHNTLFRGNSTLTRTIEAAMHYYGKAFRDSSVGSVIRRLCAEKVAIEVDPTKISKGVKDIERNVDLLTYWCKAFWEQIYITRNDCPYEMRRIFQNIKFVVEDRYNLRNASIDTPNRDLPLQAVSSFCFLRFLVPAILNPHLFGLCPGLPDPAVQRSLKLIAKVMQSLANLNTTVQREEYMRPVKSLLQTSLHAMVDYIHDVSTPIPDQQRGPYAMASSDSGHQRLAIVNSLRQRGPTLPTLVRESVPLLPQLLDVPRQMALISSTVIRHARGFPRPKTSQLAWAPFDEFSARCFEVEELALRRVSKLASNARSARDGRRSTSAHGARTASRGDPQLTPTRQTTVSVSAYPPPPPSPFSATSPRFRKTSSSKISPTVPTSDPQSSQGGLKKAVAKRARTLSRPSTAPSPSRADFPLPAAHFPVLPVDALLGQRRGSAPDIGVPPSPRSGLLSPTSPGRSPVHYKSTSTDVALLQACGLPLPHHRDVSPPLDGREAPEDRKKKGLLRGILTRR